MVLERTIKDVTQSHRAALMSEFRRTCFLNMVSALNGRIFHFVSVYGHKAPPGVQRRSLHIVLTTYTFQIFTITQATNTYDTLYFMSKTIEEKVYTLKHPELN